MVQLNARTARPSGTKRVSTLVMPVQVLEGGEDLLDRGALMSSVAGILEAQLTQHIALFEKMCGPVKHVRLAVRRRKNGGQRKRGADGVERVVVDVASWEEEVQSFRVVPAGAESSEWLARRIKLVKFDERLGAGAEGGSGGSGGMRGRPGGGRRFHEPGVKSKLQDPLRAQSERMCVAVERSEMQCLKNPSGLLRPPKRARIRHSNREFANARAPLLVVLLNYKRDTYHHTRGFSLYPN